MQNRNPLVSIICICYNHDRFVSEAIDSVLKQTYQNIELVVVDDASTDRSKAVIHDKIGADDQIRFLDLPENVGNCKAFNQALKLVSGEFIIDLAADDVLLPDRVALGIEEFAKQPDEFGVNFTNAMLIKEDGTFLKHHYAIDASGKASQSVPEGDLFQELLSSYFISPPTMMYKKSVLDYLDGYDENLTYEDFDFWVRSSRKFKYCYTDKILVKKRVVANSKSHRQYSIGSRDIYSTFLIMKKALGLLRTENERRAWRKRALYEMRKALQAIQVKVVLLYLQLLRRP